MQTLLIATGNAHKVEEIRAILDRLQVPVSRLLCLADFPAYVPPEEDGDSFRANAALKARAAAEALGLPTLADDSGLTVEALNGAPGVFSARYAGPGHDDAANRAKLLRELAAVPVGRRQAAFVCAMALALPGAETVLREGRVTGEIALGESGSGGFGYDSLFYLPELGRTMAELPAAEKDRLSHRARALEEMAPVLQKL